MMESQGILTGVERTFDVDDIIVSKTDIKGRITYANRVFMRVAGYTEKALINTQHNIIRRPQMPRCVFKLLWERIEDRKEIFAYVMNRAGNGDHYWVFAHVTPTFDGGGNIIGYHSTRRKPDRRIVENTIVLVYRLLLDEEKKHANDKEGLRASSDKLKHILAERGSTYDELIFSL